MQELSQRKAPLFEALRDYRRKRIVRFDVPGHKGRGSTELSAFLGQDCLAADVNSQNPSTTSFILLPLSRKPKTLAAEAFGASHAFFMVSGTTGACRR